MAQEKEDGEEGRRIRGGERRKEGNALGSDAFFPWSRALTHPLKCNCSRHRDSRGREVPLVVP